MFPTDILKLIASYALDPPMVLCRDLTFSIGILKNPHAMSLIESYLSSIGDVSYEMSLFLVENPNPLALLYIDIDRYPALLGKLCKHPSEEAMCMVSKYHKSRWDFTNLCSNPYAMSLIRVTPEKWVWEELVKNTASYEILKECIQSGFLVKLRNHHTILLHILNGVHSERLFKEIPEFFPEGVVIHCSKLVDYRLERFGQVRDYEYYSHPGKIEEFRQRPIESWNISGLLDNPNPAVEELILLWLDRNEELDEETVTYLCESRFSSVLERVEEFYSDLANPEELSLNSEAIDLLLEHPEWIRWGALSRNPSHRVVEVVIKYKYSFLASPLRLGIYKRREVLEVDEEKYKEKVKLFLSL